MNLLQVKTLSFAVKLHQRVTSDHLTSTQSQEIILQGITRHHFWLYYHSYSPFFITWNCQALERHHRESSTCQLRTEPLCGKGASVSLCIISVSQVRHTPCAVWCKNNVGNSPGSKCIIPSKFFAKSFSLYFKRQLQKLSFFVTQFKPKKIAWGLQPMHTTKLEKAYIIN